MKKHTFLIKYFDYNSETGYSYDMINSYTANAAYGNWIKNAGEKLDKFIHVEDMNGVVYELN